MAESVGLSHARGVVAIPNHHHHHHHNNQYINDISLDFRDIKRILINEGLKDIAHLNVGDQLVYLLEERRYLQQELLELSAAYRDNNVLNFQAMLEKQKDDYESELHDQRLAMQEVKEQLDRVHQNDVQQLENEKKLMEQDLKMAQDKISELQGIIDKLQVEGKLTIETKCTCKDNLKQVCEHRDNLQIQLNEQQNLISQLKDKIRVLEKLNRQIELDNETLSFKLSEVLAQYDDLEDQLRKEKTISRRNSTARQSTSSDSPSRINNLHSLLENKISTAHHELGLVSQIKKLQFQVSKLQDDLIASNKKNELLMIKYQQRKQRHRERIYKIKGEIEEQTRDYQGRLSTLSHSKEMAEKSLSKEMEWRAKVETDCSKLLNEKRHLLLKLVDFQDQTNCKHKDKEF